MSPPLCGQLPADARHAPDALGAATSRELIRLENITKTYRLGELEVPVLKGVSLSIARGEMVALMGASGSGKTTLMNILGCLDRPTSGQFWLDGQEMSRLTPNERAIVRTAKLGFVFQSFNLLSRTSALQNVLMPLEYSTRRPHGGTARHSAEALLTQVGLAARLGHESSQMSGGQQQRVAIARALINRPALLLADEPTGNLDSRTGDEILRMFQRLHAQGITVILVTHDPKVAGYADRTIRIADGMIEEPLRERISKRRTLRGRTSHEAERPVQEPMSASHYTGTGTWGEGEAWIAPHQLPAQDLVRLPAIEPANENQLDSKTALPQLALPSLARDSFLVPKLRSVMRDLRRNKLRSALAALGIIIGVAAVIAMTEIGQGSKAEIEKTIASMGAYKLPIFPAAAVNGGVSQGAGTVQTLKPDDVEEIARQCPAVADVVPMVGAQAQAVYGGRNWVPQQLTGTTPNYLAIREWEDLEEGSCFSDDDVRTSNPVCLIGATVERELFDGESAVGKTLRIRNVPFRVLGVLSPRGANMNGQDQDDCIIAPWTAIKFRVNSQGAGSAKMAAASGVVSTATSWNNPYCVATSLYPLASPLQQADSPLMVRQSNIDFILAKAAGAAEVPRAIEQISALLRERHHLAPGANDDFKILNLTEIARATERTANLVGMLLLVVAGISLFVSGVGIMNIMLVSVTERTREIGLRMAVGARSHHILRQFLAEAVFLCLVGGAIG
ncbi:MAG: ABC transporter permease, partial [Planctomycetia bacterium]|nr:ABC transporter permease [Planctomycetia bacterium]